MHRWQELAQHVDLPADTSRQTEAIRRRWEVWATVSQAPAGALRLVDEAAAKVCGMTDRSIRTYRSIFQNLVVPFPKQFALLNASELGKSLREMARLAALSDDARRLVVDALLSNPDLASVNEVLKAIGLERSQGWRTDPNNLHAVLEAEFGRLFSKPPAVQDAFLKELPNKLDKESAERLAIDLQLKWNF